MTSLSEAYERQMGEYASLRRLYVGVGLFLLGTLLVVAGIVVTASSVGIDTFGQTTARLYGGVLAGLGLPAVFLGVFSVLPADRRTRAAAIVGAGIAVFGVALFVHAYPCRWVGTTCGEGLPNLTLPTVGLYFLGAITTFWCLFVGVANFKSRNDPGGTVKLEVTREGETRVVEVSEERLREGATGAMGSLGGVGFLGGTPDGDVETQTAGGEAPPDRRSTGEGGTTASDGGATTDGARPFDDGSRSRSGSGPAGTGAGSADADGPANPGDVYCGSCRHFEYVRTEEGMRPYCGFHDGLMDDMDACEEWTPRR